MDSDSIKSTKTGDQQEKNSDPLPFWRYIFPSSRIRHSISFNNEMDRFLLDYGLHFLCPVCIIIWLLFLFI